MKKLQSLNDPMFKELSREQIKMIYGGDVTHGVDCCTATFSRSGGGSTNDGSDPYTDGGNE